MSSSSLKPNQLHRSFELVSFIDKLPVPLTIECLTCYDNKFIVGTNTGRMLTYEVKLNQLSQGKLEASFEKNVNVTKKSIQQIEAIKEFNILIALFDSQLHVFDLEKFQLQYSLVKTKSCSLFATSISSSSSNLLRLIVACKRKLQFYYFSSGKFMELTSDLELTDIPRTLTITKDNMVVYSLRKEFFYYELQDSTVSASQPLKAPEVKYNIGQRSLDPICEKLSSCDDGFIVGMDENKSILYDSKGKPALQNAIAWSATPSNITGIGNYLIATIYQTNTVEVVTVQPKSTSIQAIDAFNSQNSSSSQSALSSSQQVSSSPYTGSLQSRLIDNVSSLTSGLASGLTNVVGSVTPTIISSSSSSTSLSGIVSANVSQNDRLKILKSNGSSVCYVASASNVWCLIPVRINEQLDLVLRYKTYDLGISLIEAQLFLNSINSGKKSSETGNSGFPSILQPFVNKSYLVEPVDEALERRVRNMHALDLFCGKKKFTEALQLFQKTNTDPTHLIAFLPGLLPDQYRAKLNFDEYYVQLNAKEQEEAIAALIDYLQFKRAEFLKMQQNGDKNDNSQLEPLIEGRVVLKTRKQALQILDTTLLKCYLKSKENLVQSFLRRDASFLHLEESERLLKQHNKLNELIILYEKKEAHEKALNLLVAESTKSNSHLAGYRHIVEYMRKLGNLHLKETFKFAKQVLEADPHQGIRVFMSGNVSRMDRVIVKKALEKEDAVYLNSRQNLNNMGIVKRTLTNESGKMFNMGIDVDKESRTRKFDSFWSKGSSNLNKYKNQISYSYFNDSVSDLTSKDNKQKEDEEDEDLGVVEEEDESVRELDHKQVVQYLLETIQPKELSQYLVRVYLQYCIYIWNESSSELNNMLIDIYKYFIENIVNLTSLFLTIKNFSKNSNLKYSKSYRHMLKYFLLETQSYDSAHALACLDLENYAEERAIVLGKMGKHHEALSIYVNVLNDTEKAETYCEKIYAKSDVIDSNQVYYELLQIYLNSDYEEIRIDGSIRLLNAHSREIGSSRTLDLLPAQLMKCKNLSQFFENMLARLARNKHDTQIRNRLMIALQLQVLETKIMCQDKRFVVTDEQICKACSKRIGKSAMVRYPNGILIHYGCMKNYDATSVASYSKKT